MLRLFVDEFGHHDLKSSDNPEERYLGLTGVIMPLEYERGVFTDSLNHLKDEVFGRHDFSLHRREIVNKSPEPFTVLQDADTKRRFDEMLMQWIGDSRYRAITVLIDKKEHKERYAVWRFHPYHYCMTAILERYVQLLERINEHGDAIVESRGKKENKQLSASYILLRKSGTDYVDAKLFQARISTEIKLKPKTDNISGLQLCDLLVNPACRHLICFRQKELMQAEFGKGIVGTLYRAKYLRNPRNGRIPGWGTKMLP